MRFINVLDLFAGAAGMLSSQWLKGWRTVCYVEWAEYPARVIETRIRDGFLDDAPIWDDVGTFDGRPWRGFVDVIKAGFPCQPFSVAGKGLAADDPRDGWPHTIRIIREVRPRFVFLENVPGLLAGSHGYFGRILRELAQSGYDGRWRVLSAAELGAPHKRDRLWIVAHPNSRRWRPSGDLQKQEKAGQPFEGWRHVELKGASSLAPPVANAEHAQRRPAAGYEQAEKAGEYLLPGGRVEGAIEFGDGRQAVADANGEWQPQPEGFDGKEWGWIGDGREALDRAVPDPGGQGLAERQGAAGERAHAPATGGGWWAVEPGLGRVVNGMAYRVDRLKAIGNGEVPAVAAAAWNLLVED